MNEGGPKAVRFFLFLGLYPLFLALCPHKPTGLNSLRANLPCCSIRSALRHVEL